MGSSESSAGPDAEDDWLQVGKGRRFWKNSELAIGWVGVGMIVSVNISGQ